MGVFSRIEDWVVARRYRRIAEYLSTAEAGKIEAAGERNLLRAFRRAARRVPAYGRLLAERGVDPPRVRSLEEFRQRVPVLDKRSVFVQNELRDVCAGGRLDDVRLFYTSSGHSGLFSYGGETRRTAARTVLGVEFLLEQSFQILQRRTLLINCLPMGVKIPTRTLAVAETSVRAEAVLALVRKLHRDFQQFILLAESPFLKKVIEDGIEAGVPWRDLRVHAVTGAEFIAENYRSYIGHLLGIDFEDPDRGMIGANFGLSELSLSVFRETPQTIRIRRLAHTDRQFRYALFGEGTEVCPELMQYFPTQTFVETVTGPLGRPQLVVSMLDGSAKFPLIRYNTGDTARTMRYERLGEILRRFGREGLMPRFRLPLGILWGKRRPVALPGGGVIHPEDVKEAIYEDFDVAGRLTGNFVVARRGDEVVVSVQAKPGQAPSPELAETLSRCLRAYVEADVRWEVVGYAEFPCGLEHNYQKKNRYVSDSRWRASETNVPEVDHAAHAAH